MNTTTTGTISKNVDAYFNVTIFLIGLLLGMAIGIFVGVEMMVTR